MDPRFFSADVDPFQVVIDYFGNHCLSGSINEYTKLAWGLNTGDFASGGPPDRDICSRTSAPDELKGIWLGETLLLTTATQLRVLAYIYNAGDPGLFRRPWLALEEVTCVGQLFGDQDLVCDILMWKRQMDLV
ncbi:hypothetical protein TNCV_5113541 [Trichonephila clavipes]|nr:hypothetical protein TNCV_5113541 [Trichonephila clavipes]